MEQAPKAREVFGKLQRHLGEATMRAVRDAVATDWREMYLDMRSTPDGTSRGMKLMVVNVAGEVLLLRPTASILDTLQKISPPWYGMRLAITSERNCQVWNCYYLGFAKGGFRLGSRRCAS